MSLIKRLPRPLNLSFIKEEHDHYSNKAELLNPISSNNFIITSLSHQPKLILHKVKSPSCESISKNKLKIETIMPLYLPSIQSNSILTNNQININYHSYINRTNLNSNEHKKDLTLISPKNQIHPINDKSNVKNTIIRNRKKRKKVSPLMFSQYLNNKVSLIPSSLTVMKGNLSPSNCGTKAQSKKINFGKHIWFNKGEYEYLITNAAIK